VNILDNVQGVPRKMTLVRRLEGRLRFSKQFAACIRKFKFISKILVN